MHEGSGQEGESPLQRLETRQEEQLRSETVAKNDLADSRSHPTPYNCLALFINIKLKRGVGPEHWKRDPSRTNQAGSDHWRPGPEQDPRGHEHWKQVVESARMFETMVQEVVKTGRFHAITSVFTRQKVLSLNHASKLRSGWKLEPCQRLPRFTQDCC